MKPSNKIAMNETYMASSDVLATVLNDIYSMV